MIKNILLSTLIVFTFVTINAQTVNTYIATPQQPGNSTVATPRLSAKMYQPFDMAVDSKGNMWIAESGNHVISVLLASDDKLRIRAGGIEQASFVDATGVMSRFNGPRGVAIGPNDEIYISDYNNHVIRKISKYQNLGNPQFITVFAGKYKTGTTCYTPQLGFRDGDANVAQFYNPSDIETDAAGNVYVADTRNHCIRKITPAGVVSTIAGQPESPGDVNGSALGQAKFNNPVGLFVDGNDIYVADKLNSKIKKISGGQVTTVVSGLWTPEDVVYDNGIFYITDLNRVRKYDGSLSTYAGSEIMNEYGFADAQGTDARFHSCKGIVMINNELYLSDQDNHIIRKIVDCAGYKPTISKNENTLTASTGKTYQWLKNGSDISGATASTYVATKTADYSVEVENNDGCKATSNSIHVVISSINEVEGENNLSIYPNPGNGKITV
ncbi:MAG: hypothetical protein U9R42_04420, partial [Bacteroidota bacterium]|nr:hypothetical protein [Bacteroidota bacterium]